MAADLSNDVRAFIERHITTGAQLEVLLLLHRERDRDWTAAVVGRELRIDAKQAEKAMAGLVAGGLLARNGSGHRYAPRQPRKADLVDALAMIYPAYRVAVISLIFSRPNGPIRDFSDAFRLKEGD